MPRGVRSVRPQIVLDVLNKEQLSAHMVRLTLGGAGFNAFQDRAVSDKYVKILFARPELGLIPPYDLETLRGQLAPKDLPVRRTYTVRRVDHVARSLDIDFVVHGDEGIAGPWAQKAKVGEKVCFSGPGGLYSPSPIYSWHLLVGDESALPAVSAAIEDMDADMVGDIYLEVPGKEDEVSLAIPAGMTLHWLHRGGLFTPGSSKLETAVRRGPWRKGSVQVFAHGERETMRSLREYLQGERGVERTAMSLSAYWAYGRAEDEFQADKRSPIGQMYPDPAVS